MTQGSQKTKKYELVRIWTEPKEQLDELMLDMSKKEKRRVTEVSLASKAITAFVKRERRKLAKA